MKLNEHLLNHQISFILFFSHIFFKDIALEAHVYLGEYAPWGNKLYNAIAEAVHLTAMKRNGDVVKMASHAPMLAKKGHNQWKTDMIFFDITTLCPTPNFYVQKLFMKNSEDHYHENTINFSKKDNTLAAFAVMDSKTGKGPKKIEVNLSKFKSRVSNTKLTVPIGGPEVENTFDNPDTVVPVTMEYGVDKEFVYSTPARSFSVIRIKTKA